MPGYIIHLAEAKMIFNILKEKDKTRERCSEEWLQKFSYGVLLADTASGKGKAYSHFWNKERTNYIVMTPQVDRFLNKYNVSMDTPELLGYLAHLDLDLKFWNEYIKKCVQFQDENGMQTENIRVVKSVFIKKTGKTISPEDFFSSEYLYGDYTKLNKYFINKYSLIIPKYNMEYKNIVQEVNNKDMKKLLLNLKSYIKEEDEDSFSLKVFSKASLEQFVKLTSEQFCEKYGEYMRNEKDEKDENLLERGLLYTLLCLFLQNCKEIWEFLIYKKKYYSDDIEKKQWIFDQWKEEWNPNYETREREPFYKLFKYDYEDTCKKIRRNKKNNFKMKFISMLPFIILVILFLSGTLIYNIHILFSVKNFGEFLEKNNWSFSIFSTALYAVAIILTVVAAKWIDVKKYQETWIRHSNHKYFIDMEMYKFIERIDEYSGMERRENFKRNIMKTWDKNQKKFSENMKKEERVGDIIDNTRRKG